MTSARTRLLASVLLAFTLTGCGALIPAHYRISAARKDMQKGDWAGAAVELGTLVKAHPDNAEAWLLLTRLSLDAGDPGDAPANLTHAVAAGAKGPEVDELQVRTWLENNQAQAVLDAFAQHKVSIAEPDRSLDTARAYLSLGQVDKSLGTLQALLAAHPDLKPDDLTQARVVMAEALASTGKVGAAMQQLDTAAKADPKSPEPPLAKGNLLASQRQFSAAESSLAAALQLMPPAEPLPHRASALVRLTEVRLAQGEIDSAAQSQALLAQLVPGAGVTKVLDARVKLAKGDISDAIDELEGVVSDVPRYTEARLLLGGALLDHGDLEQAQEQLQQVIQEAPNNPMSVQARKLLASALLKLKEPEAALDTLKPALSSQAADSQMLALLGMTAVQLGGSSSEMASLADKDHPGNEILQLNLAEAYLTTGHADKAVAILEKTADDNDMRRDALLVSALTEARGPQAAGEEVQKLLTAHPHDARVLSIAGAYFASQGELERARTLLDQALALDPRNESVVIVLARVEAATGNPSAAQHALQSALSSDPKALQVRLALADVLAGQKDFDQALSVLNEADPAQAGPLVLFAIARVHLAQGDVKAADASLDRAIAMRPGQAPIVEAAGSLLLAANQNDAALARFVKATTLAPENPLYWVNAARAQLALKQSQAARTSLQTAAKLRPHWVPVVSLLCTLDLNEHHDQAALDRVNALVASEPQNPEAQILKGDVEARTGHLSDAMSAYAAAQQQQPSAGVVLKEFQVALKQHSPQPQKPLEDWLASHPSDTTVGNVLGNYYLGANDLPAAAHTFQAVVRLSPNDLLAINNLAWVEEKLGHADALALAERAYKLAPQSPDVEDTLGWILARRHQTARALALLERAAKQSPGNPEMQYHYAYVLVQDGKREDARQILTKLLADHPKFDSQPEAERLLASTRT